VLFLGYIHAFRGVAILIVLLGHARLLMPWPELRDSPWSLRLLSTLVEGGTVPFIFIAGYLFQHLAPRFEYGPFLRTKLKNVVAPYVVVSLPILAHAFVFRSGLYAERDAMGVREVVLVGAGSLLNARHAFVPYWFIPMICMVLLAAPALLAIDRRPKLYFGLLLAIPLAALLHRSELHVNPLQDAAHLLPVFVLGMLISRYREAGLRTVAQYRSHLLAFMVCTVAVEIAVGQGGSVQSSAFSPANGWVDFNFLQKVALSLVALEFLARNEPVLRTNRPRIWGALSALADISFGLFFLHIFINLFIAPLLFKRVGTPAATPLNYVLLTSLYVPLAVALTLAARRATGRHSRVLIGT
jgi:fucose 4-O-acetylase-like acetyltransferase